MATATVEPDSSRRTLALVPPQPPSLLDALPALAWRSGRDGGRTEFNGGWLAFTGRRLEDELGWGWLDGVLPEDQAACREVYGRGKPADVTIEYRLRRHDGEYRWVSERAAAETSLDGALRGYSGVTVDATSQRLLAVGIVEASHQLEALVDALPDGHVSEPRQAWSLQAGLSGTSALEEAKAALETMVRRFQDVKEHLDAEKAALQQEARRAAGFDDIVGTSLALDRVLAQVAQVAPTDAPVLLLGETGTGKDLAARALHDRSRRAGRPFITVNCAALPATLVESELFGYEKGAFTGAQQRTAGRFEVAHGGTLFLDEIGELPPGVQAKLLRALQTGEFERLGSARTTKVDVRLIAATNRNLEEEMRQGVFRADLFYRLSVFPIHLPSLRDRREDIPLLVWHFIERRQAALGKSVKRVPERLMRAFCAYGWPGNVRELENIVERALIMTQGPTLMADPAMVDVAPITAAGSKTTLAEAERLHIRAVLDDCGWKIAGKGNAAERLGLKRSTLQFRMKKLGLERPAN
jgi:PAS domain S-box-containing protein